MTKASELREMSDEQLAITLKEAREVLFRRRLQAQTERLDAPSELRKNRRLIARIKTIQCERAERRAKQREGLAEATVSIENVSTENVSTENVLAKNQAEE